eukprot:jgi/Mesen1/7783/ME000408S06894
MASLALVPACAAIQGCLKAEFLCPATASAVSPFPAFPLVSPTRLRLKTSSAAQVLIHVACCPSRSSRLCTSGRGNRRRFVLSASLADPNPTPSEDGTADGTAAESDLPQRRRDMLLEYVKSVQPEIMDRFISRAPEPVVEAMRQTVTNMLGTLPPQFFEVTVTTVGENLAQLMYSVIMTGYMFRNAQYRLELQQSLSTLALPDPRTAADSGYEAGVQKSRVQGEVLRWHKDDGAVAMDAVEYIELLEGEIELTQSAGEDAVEAMNTFVRRLLGVQDPAVLKVTQSQTTAVEMAKMLYWLMVVGYSIRNIEVRFDMEKVLGAPAKLAELPPGEL